MKKEYYLKNLHCTNCGEKIERRLKKIDFIKDVQVDFITKKIYIETKEDIRGLDKKVKKTVHSVEPNCIIEERKYMHEEEIANVDIMKYIIAVTMFLTGIILDNKYSFYLLIIAYIIIGYKIIVKSIKNIIRGNVFDENFLMSLATLTAIGINQYKEAVAVMLFYSIGEMIQNLSVESSRNSIKELLKLKEPKVNCIEENKIVTKPIEKIKIGEVTLVKSGEKVPLDGSLIDKVCICDTSPLTGELVPKVYTKGESIKSGIININEPIRIKVDSEYKNSTIKQVLDLVENSTLKKGKSEKMITKFSKVYTPIILIIAFMTTILGYSIFGGKLVAWIYKSLIFLVLSCPCALVLSIPLGYFSGIGAAAKHGIMIKGSKYLDTICSLESIFFDKTGTITEGKFHVTEIVPFINIPKEKLIELAVAAEYYSNHPIAKTLRNSYNMNIDINSLSNFHEHVGMGNRCTYKGKDIIIGNCKLMNRYNIKIDDNCKMGTSIYLAMNRRVIGKLIFNDKIKQGSYKAINDIKELGINDIYILSGDCKENVEDVKNLLSIDRGLSDLLPQDKIKAFEELSKNKITSFVGDGINDAPVLSMAHVGIAMGGLGSDIAIEAADIVIMGDDLSKIPIIIKIAKVTRKVVLQNIVMCIGVKLTILLLGILGHSTLWGAVFADVGVALIAIFNSIRIEYRKYN
ncbi:cadmium-translocating P-type ATPase [Clostridium bornimense]|uniref:Cd(2+)-exporting ATPase n=1 Tax=Clostridium bornimense TaxID=1216932 RepID=W6S334_9CLOT|nr:heavy metal translocating P-type ATPase [Clostridium bornimense]CDM68717.1 cadmium-translocating P-type ATPase [Clostridium bornimense]